MNFRELLASLGIDVSTLPDGVLSLSDPRLTPDVLNSIHAAIETQFKAVRHPEDGSAPDLAKLTALRAAQAEITVELASEPRVEAIKAAEAETAAKLAELDAAGAKPEPEAAKPDDPAATPEVDPAKPDANVTVIGHGVTTDAAVLAEQQIELAKVAGAQTPADKVGANGEPTKPTAQFVTAAAGTEIAPLGNTIELHQIGERLGDVLQSMVSATISGQTLATPKVVLASLQPIFRTAGVSMDGILSTEHTAQKNTQIITDVLEDWGKRLDNKKHGKAHTAAAPWCEPFDTIRALPTCVTTDTPVRNSLPFIPMGYGGFQFNQGYQFADLWGAVDIWTAANQAAIDPTDPDTWKRCMSLICPDTLPTVSLDDWLTACLEWQVGMDINNPERFKQAFALLEGVRARLVEQYTLSLLDALVMNYKNDVDDYLYLGGVPDLVAAILAMFQGSTYNGRTTGRAGYTMYLDTDMMETLIVSEMRAAYAKTDGTREGIKRYILDKIDPLSAIVEVKDRIPGHYGTVAANGNPKANAAFPADAQADIAVPALVTAGRIRIIPTAEVFAFGTGEMRTGARQDYSYARQNKVGWFAEEAFALTKYGCQPWFALNATINPRGFYVGAVNRNISQTETEPVLGAWVADNAGANVVDPNP